MPRLMLMTLATLAASVEIAHAQGFSGFSTDIELVRPTFSPRSTLGVESPYIGGEGNLSIGLQTQYARDPLKLIEFDRVTGPVVRNRVANHLGFAWAPSKRLSLRAVLPMVWQWGSTVDEYRGDGLALGDVSAGLRYQMWEGQGVTLGMFGDFVLNMGTRDAYAGEVQPRTSFGFLTAYETGPFMLLSSFGFQTRSRLDTQLDFNLGNELVMNVAGVYTVAQDGTAVTAELLSRFGLARLFTGAAESSIEWLAGGQVPVSKNFKVHLGVGRGITAGYGTSSFRALASLRFERTPPPVIEEPDFFVEILDIPEDLLDETPPPPAPETIEVSEDPGEWREGELARIVTDRIEIREPIQFEFATARILPVSLPLLKQVASLLNRNASIAHLLIEGHASQEGSYVYNYDLSIRRSRAVHEQLVVLGVHPARMSYRGMGKTVPVNEGTDEMSLAENRRVEFQIIHQYVPGDTLPDYKSTIKLPWSGEPANVEVPTEIPEVKIKLPTKAVPAEDLLAPTEPPSTTLPTLSPDTSAPLPPPPDVQPDLPVGPPSDVAPPEETP
jgi:outer membrane protein OmpA-like peptidoglycan-associated protein